MLSVVEGIVVSGDHRGRELGFPTANVLGDESVPLPDEGVYAGYVTREQGTVYVAAISIGHRPTFYDETGTCLVEAHLLDFDGDLYGERLRVEITEQVRDQRRFETVEELVDQIRRDVARVRLLTALPRHG
ncbi:MAG TPA: riboflavin kinase [Acidimicrobiales bacterium]|nr:riboflavin kinase [Acidimicrobiales bacterium]